MLNMTEIEAKVNRVLMELEHVKSILTGLAEQNRWQSIPKASVTLETSQAKLKQWCSEGRIPCRSETNGTKKIHYKVDVIETAKWLAAGGIIGDLKKSVR